MDMITSRQNPLIRRMAGLHDRENREKEEMFLVEGIKLFREAVQNHAEIPYVFLRSDVAENIIQRINDTKDNDCMTILSRAIYLDPAVFERISTEKSPEGIICAAKYIDKLHKIVTINNIPELPSLSERVILLESVRDPGNLGTIIRCAAAFGIDRLVVSKDCADLYHERTIRASMGALFHARIDIAADFTAYVSALASERRVFAAALGQSSAVLGNFNLQKTDCIVIGNEGHGISAGTMCACTDCLLIPMRDGTESLNAAMAATVCMWEMFRGSH